MNRYPDGYKHALFEIISDAAADHRVGASIALDVLIDEVGWLSLFGSLDTALFDLLDEVVDLTRLAEAIRDEIYAIPGIDWITPFDGTIRAELEEGDNEEEWLMREDILPFLERWRSVLLGFEVEAQHMRPS